MLRDILRETDQLRAIADVVGHAKPDVLVLGDIDYDLHGAALRELANRLGDYQHVFTSAPNRGHHTGRDLNGDGRLGSPEDAEGYATFSGQGGMGVLSNRPIHYDAMRDFTDFAWHSLPGNIALQDGHDPTRLSTTVHWDIPVKLGPDQALHLLVWHGTAPVFDGPEDRNGRRNHDETAFWLTYLENALPFAPPEDFVIIGTANADPFDGESRPDAIRRLLDHPKVRDTRPESPGARAAGNLFHRGPAETDTVDWPDGPGKPGNLRVDYVLPASHLQVMGSAVVWPGDDTSLGGQVRTASRHRLVWVDIQMGDRPRDR